MLDKLVNIGTGAMDLAEVRAKLLVRDLESSGALLLTYACVALVGAAGFLAILCGLTVWVSQFVGPAAALALLGVALLLVAAISLLLIRWRVRRSDRLSRTELQQEEALIRERLTGGSGGEGAKSDSENSHFSSLASSMVETITKHPETAASGLFALVTLLGPMRIFRLLGKASAVASALAVAAKFLSQEDAPGKAEEKPPQREPRPERHGVA